MLVAGLAASALAEVVTDGTVGPCVRLGGDFEIGADLGTRAGRKLFHSFERFSLATGERATFSGPDEIRNVISQVTGGARSDIDGTIRSTLAGADFFFLNPAGIAFGPNARLDLKGSLHISTRTSCASPTAACSAPLIPRLLLHRRRPASVRLPARRAATVPRRPQCPEVPAGGTLSIVGGDIDIVGGPLGLIRAEAGQIALAAVAARARREARERCAR